MRAWVVAIVTVCGFAGCGRDPILEKAEADAAEAQAARGGGRGDASPAPGDGAPGGDGAGANGAGVPGAAQPGDASGGAPVPMGPDGQPLPGSPDEPTPGIPDAPTPGVPGSMPTPVPGASATVTPGAPRPGIPTEPAPGIPSQPPPGGGGGGPMGPTVKVSGEVVYPAWKSGRVRITAFNGDHGTTTGGRPDVIGMADLERPGPFVVPIAEGAGKVYLEASVDEDGDGRPGPLDPQGKANRFPVTVDTSPVDGLTIVLTRREPPPGGRGQDF
ncbi:MAG: hypothetical protein Q8P41_14670 [Pseudomonadota bacterium]|nr:hypothetical protein [Pseudomonadota bacterium]